MKDQEKYEKYNFIECIIGHIYYSSPWYTEISKNQ